MRVSLIRIGNSRGIRIPKRILEQCRVVKELELVVENEEIRLRPIHHGPREGWREAVQAMQERHGVETPDAEWLNAELVSDEGLEKQA